MLHASAFQVDLPHPEFISAVIVTDPIDEVSPEPVTEMSIPS
tara:strand:+ start:1036 stop:1161 length:126 start_codon:yes stop_codon:yes gene_type:complete